ncbi:MAG TPA: hypothetical protein VIL01_11035 [Thermomicrobiales bacterium]
MTQDGSTLPPDLTNMTRDVRNTLAASRARLQLTRRRMNRGEVDLGQLAADLADLDHCLDRVLATLVMLESNAPITPGQRESEPRSPRAL